MASTSDSNESKILVDSTGKADNETNASGEPKSKRQRKREEQYLLFKEKRRFQRKQRKERVQAKRAAMKEQGIELPAKPAVRKMADSSCNIHVVIDCSFNSLMTDKDIGKLHHQLGHCYGLNRRAENPLQLHFTDLSGPLLNKFKSTNEGEFEKWDVNMHFDSLDNQFPSQSIVYLSAESDTVLSTLEPDKVYVIGGLVDHNHHKGHCHDIALQKNYQTARLPIGEDWVDLKLNQRSVLAVTHVFEALLYWTECKDWKQSLYRAIPKRKIEFCGQHSPVKCEDTGQSTTGDYLKTTNAA